MELVIGQLRENNVVEFIESALEANEDTKGTVEKVEVVSFEGDSFVINVWQSVEKNNYITLELIDGFISFDGSLPYVDELDSFEDQLEGVVDMYYDTCLVLLEGDKDVEEYLETLEFNGLKYDVIAVKSPFYADSLILEVNGENFHVDNADIKHRSAWTIYEEVKSTLVDVLRNRSIA